jgi:N-hydroxyarylamine O-acetyltransferase
MNVQTYLDRINYDGPLGPTAEALRQLQVAHLLAVPFENLSIHACEPIVLDDQALFRKIVSRRRGGFCYELNGLFAALLRAMGFEVVMLSAQVANADSHFSPDFDHMALMATIEEPWLVDVGFGDSFVEPLLLDERDSQVQGDRAYRVVSDGERLVVMQRDGVGNSDEWKSQYCFTLKPYQYSDYAQRCEYHQTSPQSHFTKARICSRLTPQGRITLSDMRFITTEGAARRERPVATEKEYADILRQHFGIVMKQ